MKKLGLYVIISAYSVTRWIADHYDSNTFYFIADGIIIGLIGFFLYLNSKKDTASKLWFALMVFLGASQAISETHAHLYNSYIELLPVSIAALAVFELYNYRKEILSKVKWTLGKIASVIHSSTKWIYMKCKYIDKLIDKWIHG